MNFPELTTKFTATFKEVYAAPDGTYERGYNDGHAQGYDDGYAIGEAEGYKDGKTDGYNSGYGEGYTTGEAEGYENGKQAEYDAFWDRFQQNGTNTYYAANGAFYGGFWGFNNFYPKYDIKPVGSSERLFYNWNTTRANEKGSLKQRLEECGVVLDTSQATNLTNAFAYCNGITELPTIDCTGLSAGNSAQYLFAYCYGNMETIEKVIVKDNILFTAWFTSTNLKNIAFDGVIGNDIDLSSSNRLSTDSIKSVVNHLSDTATGKKLTLSKTAVNNAVFGDAITANVGGAMSNFIPTITVPVADGERVKVTLETDEGHYIGTDYFWGELKPDDWYIGICSGGEPCEREFILSQENYSAYGGTGYIYVWFATGGAANFNFKVRAVRIDENGNEIDGINLYNVPDGTYTEYNGTTYTLTKESWESLAASKPNWTITLS